MYYTKDQLAIYRNQGDPIADEVIKKVYEQPENGKKVRKLLTSVTGNTESFPIALPPFLEEYFYQTSSFPSWADQKKIETSAKFFESNAQEIMSMLGYYSLPYCYAAANGAKVLWQSERTKSDTSNRLLETAQFVLDVMDKDAFGSNGFGIRSIQKVRLLHAAIRFHVSKSPKWSNDEWGIPVNQEDMAGTNLAFSFIILRGLRKLGMVISQEATEAYLHTWNVIGYLLGVDELLLPADAKAAFWLEKNITERNFAQSAEGIGLTQALVKHLNTLPITVPRGYHTSSMRFLMGDQIADLLQLPPPNWTTQLVKNQNILKSTFDFFQNNYEENRKKNFSEIKRNIDQSDVNRSYTLPKNLPSSN